MPETVARLSHEDRLALRWLVSERRKELAPYISEAVGPRDAPAISAAAKVTPAVDAATLYALLAPAEPTPEAKPSPEHRGTHAPIYDGPSLLDLIPGAF